MSFITTGFARLCARTAFIAFTLLAAHAAAVSGTSAQESGGSRIVGLVHDAAGDAIANASVTIEGTNLGTLTDATGHFAFNNVSGGVLYVRVERLGYVTVRVRREAGAAGVLDIAMAARAVELTGVTVIGSGRESAEIRERLRVNPGSVAMIEPDELRATRQANLPDILRFTPGVFAQPRFGAADESQLSIRGSGLRNNFHLRGVNVLVNGMPYRNADGFTDFESLELLTANSIQVYKAASAFRYGGSTLGGAVDIETKTGYTAERANINAEAGGFGFFKGQISSGAVSGPFDYYVSFARTQLDGYRAWSDQKRDRLNLHAGYVLGTNIDMRAFYLYANISEHLPGSLTAAELAATPEVAVQNNVTNKWGRDYQLHHFGLQARAQITPTQRIEVAPYLQYRDIVHPIFQVLDQISRDVGTEVRYENTSALGSHANDLSIGFQYATGNIDDRQYVNNGGNEGALTKNQRDRAGTKAIYAENRFNATPHVALVAGLRWASSLREVEDRFPSNGDQSASRTFDAFTPRIGVLYDVTKLHGQVYANASRTYEPPLLIELNSLAVPGFVNVLPQDARQIELGTRGNASGWTWDAALYTIDIRNEILNVNVQPFPGAPFTVPSYRNAERTRHRGIEAALEHDVATNLLTHASGGDRLSAHVAYTLNHFTFQRDSLYEGNRIPGAPENVFNGELVYRHPAGITLRPSVEWVSGSYFANSANAVRNDGWVTIGGRAELLLPRFNGRLFVEGRNLTDQLYSGAVTVDDAGGRYFLPADRRSVYAGVQWQH
jgi:iron complex outermembrane receptor protein